MRAAVLLLALSLIAIAPQAPPAGFPATIDQHLSHGEINVGMLMAPATADEREALRGLVPDDVEVSRTTVPIFRAAALPLFLAELGGQAYMILGDFNRDRRIAPDERVPISGAPGAPPVVVHLPLPGGQFAAYPIGFREPQRLKPIVRADGEVFPGRLMIKASIFIVVRGTVEIGGRRLAFELPIDEQDGGLHLDRNTHHLDADGDGTIDRDARSRERMIAFGAPPVFRVDQSYLSLASADLATGRARFVSRPAGDYERIEVHPGAEIPDFSFVDLAGKTRRLSDYRGKHVLLDFWGTWCGPCIAQLPYLSRADAAFHARGLEILGMDDEKPDVTPEDFAAGLARVRAFVRERELPWTQARTESIKRLFERRFQIGPWPTTILLDREGRVISANRVDRGEPGLHGEALLETLAKLLPPKPPLH